MFCRADGGRVAQITGPSTLDGRILDSVAVFWGGAAGATILTVKHVILATWGGVSPIALSIPTENDDFAREGTQKLARTRGISGSLAGPGNN